MTLEVEEQQRLRRAVGMGATWAAPITALREDRGPGRTGDNGVLSGGGRRARGGGLRAHSLFGEVRGTVWGAGFRYTGKELRLDYGPELGPGECSAPRKSLRFLFRVLETVTGL